MTYIESSRRKFLKTLTTSALVSSASMSGFGEILVPGNEKCSSTDTGSDITQPNLQGQNTGPASPLFKPLDIKGNINISALNTSMVSSGMAGAAGHAPSGSSVAFGMPFNIPGKVIYLKNDPFVVDIEPQQGKWIIFMHTSDSQEMKKTAEGFYQTPFRGIGLLNEEIASYIVIYEDGTEVTLSVRQRYQIGMFKQIWGENCIEAVSHNKPRPLSFLGEMTNDQWGWVQTRVSTDDRGDWINWLWAWENTKPQKKIKGFRFVPMNKMAVILSAVTIGNVSTNPLRWTSRRKALLTLQSGVKFNPIPDKKGLLTGIQADLGQIISASPRTIYPDQEWKESYNNKLPAISDSEIIVEYTAHPEAMLYITGQDPVPVASLTENNKSNAIKEIRSADRKVKIRVVEKDTGKVIPVKFHAHGESGEYLAPADRHRQPNDQWFEDYSVDFVHRRTHNCTYITGETIINLPQGKVYIEISKGFEIIPVRKVIDIGPETEVYTFEIEKALHWREKGWVTADTHVHFLSPSSAMLEGSAEGVNIVNLLASQWGELMTNVGDFDGKTTHGSKIAGGDGEYMVRVGTENRQHIMGHISLLGYGGNIIAPMTTGGPDESAIGDPVEILLTEWARQCKKQDGVVILPHFPNPRLENAAAIVSGEVDGVEMTSWGSLYEGIDPYSLTDWYRYLNCGYFVAAVGGTDKMSAGTAVGTVRTYARLREDKEFTYDEWKESIRRGQTFVTYGPLIEFSVEGKPAGSHIDMPANGGTVNISWEVASVTVPMTKVELIVNGEVKESISVDKWKGNGSRSLRLSQSSWVALLIRGKYPDKREIIVAHTSPVMIMVKNSPLLVATDGLTILEQIEGAMAYLNTIGTKAEEKVFKRMMMVLTSAHRTLHNRMHELGYFHPHTPLNDHTEHH